MGDGMTDIACMTLVKKNGGKSIAIYPEKKAIKSVKSMKMEDVTSSVKLTIPRIVT